MSDILRRLEALQNAAQRSPSKFIDLWCLREKINRNWLLAAQRSRKRQELCAALKRQFPKISASRVGELLGIDHSTVIYAWRKHDLIVGPSRRPIYSIDIEAIRELAANGMSATEIRDKTGRDLNTVRRILDPAYDARQRADKKRCAIIRRQRQQATRKNAEQALLRR